MMRESKGGDGASIGDNGTQAAYAVGVAQFFAWYAARSASELQWKGMPKIEPLDWPESAARSEVEPGTSHSLQAPPETSDPLTDHGRRHFSGYSYRLVEAEDLDSLRSAVAWANENRVPIRIRGKAHSMNGSSVPRASELLVSMQACRHFRFEEEGTITVGAGAAVWDVNETAKSYGFELLVYNDGGAPASSVGGYLSAGGIGEPSSRYGGFWETVKEVVMISGDARVMRFGRSHEEFRWLFGSMGQLGIAFELKLRIRPVTRVPREYPAGAAGVVRPNKVRDERILWYTLFVPEAEWVEAGKQIIAIGARHRRAWRPRWPYVYFILFRRFNPPLIHPAQESLKAVGIWGTPHASGFDWEAVHAIEREVDELVSANPRYRRYVQAELMPSGYDYRRYFGDRVYDEFMAVKRSLDPNGLMVPRLLEGAR